MIILMNSAMMLIDGTYKRETITHDEFVAAIKDAEGVKSYIGYEQNVQLIKNWTGVEIECNREMIDAINAPIYIMSLKYRPDVLDKGSLVDPDDFQYLRVQYHA